jgi:hypothetical protein
VVLAAPLQADFPAVTVSVRRSTSGSVMGRGARPEHPAGEVCAGATVQTVRWSSGLAAVAARPHRR